MKKVFLGKGHAIFFYRYFLVDSLYLVYTHLFGFCNNDFQFFRSVREVGAL